MSEDAAAAGKPAAKTRTKEWRDPEGSIIRKKEKRRDSKGRLREVEIIYARVRYVDNDGRRREKKRVAASAADAVQVRRNLRQEIDDALRTENEEKIRPKTFNEVLDYYEQEFVKAAVIANDQKIDGYKEDLGIIRRHIKMFRASFGDKLAKDITYDEVRQFKIARLKEPVVVEYYEKIALTETERALLPKGSRRRFRREKKRKTSARKFSSVHRELARLRRIFNIALRQGWIFANPFALGESLIQPALETPRLRIASFDEEKRLIGACRGKREHLETIIRFAIDTAMRKGEIFRLEWKDVDFDAGRIFVRASNTKTGRSRFVPVTTRLKNLLEPLRAGAEQETDRVFGIETDADTAWSGACEKCGITDLTFHDLRATAITRMLRAGMSEAEVMKISGHAQYSTFLKYVRQDESGAASATAKMDAYLTSQNGS